MNTAAKQAVTRSIAHNEIVCLPLTPELEYDLRVQCDDHATTETHVELWGEWDGDEWRVHLAR
jgi:hypothetical protein